MRVSRVTAWSVAGWTAFVTSCLLVTAGALSYGDTPFGEDAVLAIGFTGLAALLLSQRPGHPIGVLCLTPVLAAAAYALQTGVGRGVLGDDLAGWMASWIWLPGLLPILTVMLIVLPDGQLPGRRWRFVAWLVSAAIVIFTIVVALAPGAGRPPGPVEIPALGPLLPPDEVWVVTILATAAVCLACPVIRLRGAGPELRAQLLWVLLGAAAFVLGSVVNSALPLPWSQAAGYAAALALPTAFGVAVLRHGLLDLNRHLQRVLVVLVLGTILVAMFATGTLILGDSTVAAATITVAAGLLAPLLARMLTGGIRRLVYGPAGDPGPVITRLVHRLGAVSEPDGVVTVLASCVRESLPTTGVRVELSSPSGALHHHEHGVAGRFSNRVELRFAGSVLGELAVDGHRMLDDAEKALLDGMADAASAAVAAAHRELALRRSRSALVVAREQERRRIARDLHDGVGPVLSGLGFTLDALRASLDDRKRADRAAEQVAAGVRDATQIVRRVASELRPAALDQLGLDGSLAELAARHQEVLDIDLDVQPASGRAIAAAAEVAAYAIVAEALTNTARHADATRCTIRVRFEPGAISLSVLDDGVGVRGNPAGFGRTSMAERAAELGGWCVLAPGDDRVDERPGTLVRALLPDGSTS